MADELEITVDCVLTGRKAPFARGVESAIVKTPVEGKLKLAANGLFGDEQADLRHHGGADKAVHHYAIDHYESWQSELAHTEGFRKEVFSQPGAFGENIVTRGLTESDICIGDQWRLGNAVVEVSQARQPCWKLNERFGIQDMARRVQTSGRTGWYYRVIETGDIASGDSLILLDRPCPTWPLSRLLYYFYHERMNTDALNEITRLSALAPSWRALAKKRVERLEVEDWSKRMEG